MQYLNDDQSITNGMVMESVDGVPLLQLNLIGNVNNYYPNREKFEVVGSGSGLNNVRLDVTNIGAAGAVAQYVFPPDGGIQMRVRSSDANDSANGTGIRTVRIHALVGDYTEKLIDLTMNGSTAVLSVDTDIIRVNMAHALTVWSIGQSVGDVTIENVAGDTVYARIAAGHVTSRNAVFTVPGNKQAYLKNFGVSEGTASGVHYTRFNLRATSHDNVLLPGIFIVHDARGEVNGALDVTFDVPHRFPPRCDIKISAVSDAANAAAIVDAQFDGWLETND